MYFRGEILNKEDTMKYILFVLFLGVGLLVCSVAMIRTGYDRKVDDEQQERFTENYRSK